MGNKAVSICVAQTENDYDLLILTETGEVWASSDLKYWSLICRGDFPSHKTFVEPDRGVPDGNPWHAEWGIDPRNGAWIVPKQNAEPPQKPRNSPKWKRTAAR